MDNNYKNMEDYDIIRECLSGNKECFGELLSRYKNLVFSTILRMVNDTEDAHDLAQEVFIKVYKNLDKYRPDFKFATWLIRITTNHVIDFRRKKKQDTLPIDEMLFEPHINETPETNYLRKEQHSAVIEALNQLPDMYKIPIVLFHQQGLSYQEIADVINEPLSKVKNRMFRARKMLKEYLTVRGEGVVYEL